MPSPRPFRSSDSGRVHLRSIALRGFKSFPDPVEIRLEPGVAVVVGPNGSGKSNVADAIVWAAGSLSPSELRAEKPDDVLFAGGPGRAAADYAEVELVFDNEDGEGTVEFSELSIARRLHRGGEGEYLVNRARVRRLDVVELLAEVGLGTELHSVIGQGRVEQILGSKPAERRAMIEEAAGLGRFKQRRHRAELKLARVEIQVERARDLEDEVRKRLRPLALQATAAQRAEKLVGEIEARRGRIAAAELERIEQRLAEVSERRLEADLERKGRDEKLSGVLEERRRAEDELAEAAGRHERATAALYRLKSAAERVELRREQAEETADALRADAASPRLPVTGPPTYEGAIAAARSWTVAPSDFSRALTRLREAYNEGVDAVLVHAAGSVWFASGAIGRAEEPPRSALLDRLADFSERAAAMLTGAGELSSRFEAPLKARVDSGGTRSGALGEELRALGAREAELRRAASEAAERLATVGIEAARLEREREEIIARLGADVLTERECALTDEQIEELRAEIARLERRREALGQVNPLAAEEHAREKARLEEIVLQREDLERSLAELARLRDELADTVEQRFEETYAAVERHFAEIASTLFPGGKGRLVRQEDEEEAGVEIELQPGGKKITRLSLLSGGEKALGAISFLFALFLARPCPFYLLDEVEAALDDTNIGRFVELLRRFSDRAQFIVVTHQKKTMEAADILYGVTMGAQGVTEIVSKRLASEPVHALSA
jgi:chromosome segregation ATPase